MTRPVTCPPWQQALIGLSGVTVAVVVTGVLYWARAVLIPLSMAVFLAFVLSPVVRRLRRTGLPRGPAVLLTVTSATATASVVGWVVAQQVASLTLTLPDNKDRIVRKLSSIKQS